MDRARTWMTVAAALAGLAAWGCQKPADGEATGEKAAAAHGEHAGHGAAGAAATPGEASADAKVFFIWPTDGAKVPTTFDVVFGVQGMTVTPAGQDIDDRTKGHHHIIIDGGPTPLGGVVPADEKNIHYGKGQTQAELTLPPGKHTLTMQFADGAHRSFGEKLSQTITVEVVDLGAKPKVMFLEPADGAKVQSPVKMKFGLEGLKLRPAMEDPVEKISGHHHVVLDDDPVPLGKVVPADAKHIHYGKGETEAELALPPGKHTLTLQLADGAHLSYGEKLAHTITIEVVE